MAQLLRRLIQRGELNSKKAVSKQCDNIASSTMTRCNRTLAKCHKQAKDAPVLAAQNGGNFPVGGSADANLINTATEAISQVHAHCHRCHARFPRMSEFAAQEGLHHWIQILVKSRGDIFTLPVVADVLMRH